MRILAVIPARSGSKAVKDKNIQELGGHPLLAWSVQASLSSSLIDEVVVSTDSKDYAEISKAYGATVPFLRPAEISQDFSTDLETFQHLLHFLKDSSSLPDLLIHIRPTTPLRDPLVIDNAIRMFLDNDTATSLRSVHEMSESAYKCFEINDSGTLATVFTNSTALDDANMARQSFPKTYVANGYVDILRPEFVLRNQLLHGSECLPFVTNPVIEVDVQDDLDTLRLFLASSEKNLNVIQPSIK